MITYKKNMFHHDIKSYIWNFLVLLQAWTVRARNELWGSVELPLHNINSKPALYITLCQMMNL